MDPLESAIKKFFGAQDRLVVQASDPSLRTISSMVERKSVDLSPVFQRRERWNPVKQSLLIESFLLNIPVPPIYLAEDELGTYQVIDGKQRISAVHRFLTDGLQLRGLEDLPELNGLPFSGLPQQLQSALDMRPLRAVIMLRQSHPDLKYQVFQRLNTGGESLNDQEIRNVVYRGSLNDLIYRLAQDSFLRDRLKITSSASSAYRQMADVEYVLRFLTLSETWRDFSGSLRVSMNNFMEEHREVRRTTLRLFRHRFLDSLAACQAIWGDRAFHRPDGDGWRDQMLAGMYDAQMLAVHELGSDMVEQLRKKPRTVSRVTRELFSDSEFDSAVRQGTNTPSRIVYRTTEMIQALTTVAEA